MISWQDLCKEDFILSRSRYSYCIHCDWKLRSITNCLNLFRSFLFYSLILCSYPFEKEKISFSLRWKTSQLCYLHKHEREKKESCSVIVDSILRENLFDCLITFNIADKSLRALLIVIDRFHLKSDSPSLVEHLMHWYL